MHRILDTTWRHLPTIASHYAFTQDRRGQTAYRALRGPEYGRALRALVDEAGVRGLALQRGGDWSVRAGATVVASGGCAFLSRLLGADNNTGDGALMAAEAGAELSGMEFTNAYCIAPAHSSMTRAMSYVFATYYDESGRELPIPPGPNNTPALARALLQGKVYCTLARMPQDLREALPTISPNVMLPFTRVGIDPFTDRFEVTLRAEGTVRGIGGLRVANDNCETTVQGLFVAGDAASRELVTGAISGGGNVNSASALSSGLYAGRAAATRARSDGRRSDEPAEAAGQAALRPLRHAAPVDRGAAVAAVQRGLLDYDRNIFRDAAGLNDSLLHIDAAWRDFSDHADGGSAPPTTRLRLRETAALLANARWSVGSALQREESRGMHRRTDAPQTRAEFAHRIAVGGLRRVWHRADPVPAESLEVAA